MYTAKHKGKTWEEVCIERYSTFKEHTRNPNSNKMHQIINLNTLVPGACLACPCFLEGAAHYRFKCGIHGLCQNCLQENNGVIFETGCVMCDALSKQDKANDLNRDKECDRNTLPILDLVKAPVKVGPKNLIYDYSSPYRHISSTLRVLEHPEHINLPFEPSCNSILSTPYENTVVVNDINASQLAVVTCEGVLTTHSLSEGDRIMSGTFVKKDTYLLATGHHDKSDQFDVYENYSYKINIVNLKVVSPVPTVINPIRLPLLTNQTEYPIQVVNICRQRYGVLCARWCRTVKGDTYRMNILHIYPLDSLLLRTHADEYSTKYTDPHTIQSHMLWGKRTVRLDGSESKFCDDNTICVTPSGHLCLSVHRGHKIHVYSRTGVYLFFVGKGPGFDKVEAGILHLPRSVMCVGKGDLIVMGIFGDIRVFKPQMSSWKHIMSKSDDEGNDGEYGEWKMVRGVFDDWRVRRVDYGMVSESRLWCVEGVKVDQSKNWHYDGPDGRIVDNGVCKINVYRLL